MCSSVSYNSFTILTPCAAINKEKPSEINRFQRVLVRVARLERAASTSQMSRATNCTTPGYLVVMIIARNSCNSKFFPVCGQLCGQSGFWPGFAARKNPANARVARRSVLWLFLSWIDGESLPNHPRCHCEMLKFCTVKCVFPATLIKQLPPSAFILLI